MPLRRDEGVRRCDGGGRPSSSSARRSPTACWPPAPSRSGCPGRSPAPIAAPASGVRGRRPPTAPSFADAASRRSGVRRVRGPDRPSLAPGPALAQPRGAAPARARPDARPAGRRGARRRSASRPGCWTRPTGVRGDHAADDPGAERQSPSPLLRRSSTLDAAPASRPAARDGARACTDVRINGRAVSDGPARARLDRRTASGSSPTRTTSRPCCVRARTSSPRAIGDGWYRGRLGWKPQGRPLHATGREIGLIAQLEVTTPTGEPLVVATDGRWQASTGEIRSRGPLRRLRHRPARAPARAGTRPGSTTPAGSRRARASTSTPPRHRAAHRAARPGRRRSLPTEPDGARHRVRSSTAGRTSRAGSGCAVRGRAGDGGPGAPRRGARARRVAAPAGAADARRRPTATSSPTTPITVARARVHVPRVPLRGRRDRRRDPRRRVRRDQQRHAAARRRSRARDAALNRLHENVVWSQRDNFVSVPTDCPQRDERLGWTGDAQAFAATGSTLFDSQAFWRSWLRDLALEQDAVLGVPSVVPDVVLDGAAPVRAAPAGPTRPRSSRGRCTSRTATDASSTTSWPTACAAGSTRSSREAGADGLLGRVLQFGDWLDPDAPAGRAVGGEGRLRASSPTRSSRTAPASLADAARAARRRPAAATALPGARRRDRSADVGALAATTRSRRRPAAPRRCGLGIAPESERPAVAATLATLVREADGPRRDGVPRHAAGAARARPTPATSTRPTGCCCGREMPSWLYQVDQGATTVWERWDAILPDGSIHPGTMTPPARASDEGQEPTCSRSTTTPTAP